MSSSTTTTVARPSEPNVDFGHLTIFFDSHPEEQEGYLHSYWTSLKSTLHIAFTGIVPKYHGPGTLRLIWHTHDGNQGLKDYGLHEYLIVRENFDVLLEMEEVRRVLVTGYSGQNPFLYDGAGDGMKGPLGPGRGKKTQRGGEERQKRQKEVFDNEEEGRGGKVLDIEGLIEAHDKVEREREEVDRRRAKEREEKEWKENEGLLSGNSTFSPLYDTFRGVLRGMPIRYCDFPPI